MPKETKSLREWLGTAMLVLCLTDLRNLQYGRELSQQGALSPCCFYSSFSATGNPQFQL